MDPVCERESANIVLVGAFNPAIFHPSWLRSLDLISPKEADAAKVEIVHRDLAAFTVDWFNVQVTADRFSASTTHSAFYAPLRDLVLGIFRILEHTPVTSMGLNRTLHYKLESIHMCNKVGDLLAPKPPWRELVSEPGLLSLAMMGKRAGSPGSRYTVKVEPSLVVQPLGTGVYVETNEHFTAASLRDLLEILGTHWDSAQVFGKEVAERLLKQVAS